MHQPNSYDCGVFAIANAAELAFKCDPALYFYDCGSMRKHLLTCFERGKIERFPTTGKRRIPFDSRIWKSIREAVYCICRMPNNKHRAMIMCDKCRIYFHMDCMKLDQQKSYSNKEWSCHSCSSLLQWVFCCTITFELIVISCSHNYYYNCSTKKIKSVMSNTKIERLSVNSISLL